MQREDCAARSLGPVRLPRGFRVPVFDSRLAEAVALSMLEIERRYLARVVDPASLPAPRLLRQGYLTSGEPAVRVREDGGRFVLTVKAGRGVVRREVEVDLPSAEGCALLEMAGERVLEKLRHRMGRWEVDVFRGELEGLVLAEIELAREDEPLPPPPSGVELLREVTDDGAFTNQRLAALSETEARRLVEGAYR